MAMRKVTVMITGQSPILMNRFPMEPIEAIAMKTVEERAELTTYRDPEGVLYIPGVNIQSALVAGATYSKGKGRASLQKPTAACVMVTPERLSLGVTDYEIDSRPAVNPSTGGRIPRHRARLNKWCVTFDVEWDDVLLTEVQLRKIVNDTGLRVGILDFRAECKGPFGRFIVTRWT